jgi:lysophospholipase L1-like esterase
MRQELFYLALGDSLTAGYGAPPDAGFTGRYLALAEQSLGMKIHLTNAGKTGATTADILQSIRQDEAVRSGLAQADVITLTAGGNDLIQAAKLFYLDGDTQVLKIALKHFRHNMACILREIMGIKEGENRPYAIRLVGLYNPFPEFEEAVFWVNRFNAQLRRFERDAVKMVDIYEDFLGCEDALLAEDRFHPNEHGYRLMAEKVHRIGYGPFEQRTSNGSDEAR